MKKALLFFSLLVFVLPMYAQKAYITINTFDWMNKDKIFYFKGKTRLPVGTQIKLALYLNDVEGPVELVFAGERGWEGFLGPFADKKLMPGEYMLVVEPFSAQTTPELQKQIDELQQAKTDMKAIAKFGYQLNKKEKAWEKCRDEIYESIMAKRTYFDIIVQEGSRILRKAGEASEDKEKLGNSWKEVCAKLPDFKKEYDELVKMQGEVLIHPYRKPLEKYIDILDQFSHLKYSMSLQVAKYTGVMGTTEKRIGMVLPVRTVARNIVKASHDMLGALGYQDYWGPKVEVRREKVPFKEKGGVFTFKSSRSHYSFECPKFPSQMDMGKKNSPERLTMVYEMYGMPCMIIQIQMVKFPGFTSDDDKIYAWETLAKYEWEGYRKQSGKIVDLAEEIKGERKKSKKAYHLTFLSFTNKKMRKVNTYLFFSPREKDLVYGIVYVNILGDNMQGHASIGDIVDRIAKTFKVW